MASRKESQTDWVKAYDDELGKWLSWNDMQSPEYQRVLAARDYRNWRHPFMWFWQSNKLHRAAEALHDEYDKHGHDWSSPGRPNVFGFEDICCMLAGMSLECAFKAYQLCQFDEPITDEQLRSVAKGTHDLAVLLQDTRMRCSKGDLETAKDLSSFVRWQGRYPIPKKLLELEESYTTPPRQSIAPWERYLSVRAKFQKRIEIDVTRYIKTGRGRKQRSQ